ncbi:Metal binding Ada-like protein [Vibrio crassostreae]|uniref:hypothetical protein n=1 Tax=Vibrio crassostreae TaxID=246167 RepID=UPI0020A4D349|nr:hypothetical protein [Vibrio crassostreae]CAK2392977.1 Metal binding Ada-like protein [Vibrio crassostreae]CAK2936033.1 Metal binding Ada-like protein [Vibrio crassostreae]CAK3541782.1 Metal binding Ada-like protein [Vibrio crassostreae]
MMPLQNRVSPSGELLADNARGSWLGNRGILHNEKKEIIRPWKHKNWVLCELNFKERKRQVFSQNSYSELFFLDEATALSAGHRPCASCRRQRFDEFKQAWGAARLSELKVEEIDKVLHQDRAIRGGKKVTYNEKLENLPNGVFVELEGKPWLIWRNELHEWHPDGYRARADIYGDLNVTVLTPKCMVEIIVAGFIPQVDESVMA